MKLIPNIYERYYDIFLNKNEYATMYKCYDSIEDELEKFTVDGNNSNISLLDIVNDGEFKFQYCVQGFDPDEINLFAEAFFKRVVDIYLKETNCEVYRK